MDNATITISPSQMPVGVVTTPYELQLTASGGSPPYQWRVVQGDLPFGMNLDTSGLISGTPSQPLHNSVVIEVQDSSTPPKHTQVSFDAAFSCGPLAIVPPEMEYAFQDQVYESVLQATLGQPPYTWTLASGALPGGLGLDPTGSFTGWVMDNLGTWKFTAQVTDSQSPPAAVKVNLSIEVRDPFGPN